VKYTTLRRFVRQAGLWKQPRSTVRMAPTAPGEVAEMDFEKLGTLINPLTGKRQVVYGLLVVLVYSRYAFLWPLVQQGWNRAASDQTVPQQIRQPFGIFDIRLATEPTCC
jgi:hypothetical protein